MSIDIESDSLSRTAESDLSRLWSSYTPADDTYQKSIQGDEQDEVLEFERMARDTRAVHQNSTHAEEEWPPTPVDRDLETRARFNGKQTGGLSSSVHNTNVSLRRRKSQTVRSQEQSEVIEPVVYEHEVWHAGYDLPDVYYYIVPGGLNVIFEDRFGRESMRVGEFGDSIHKPRRVSPVVIQDEFGHELYRTGDFGCTHASPFIGNIPTNNGDRKR
ncbi:hypothetical protein H0H92_010513 [Tricholoma furcatifolium]|nr:hypothetical protein H0H92_010513 [Tricholoma furcatifolium]